MLYLNANLQELLEKEAYIRSLPLKHRRFVETFSLVLSIEKTAKLLRMSVPKAYALFREESIQRALSYYQDLTSFRNTVTQDYFVRHLKQIIESTDKEVKHSDRISALSLLARITGHIKDATISTNQLVVLRQENT